MITNHLHRPRLSECRCASSRYPVGNRRSAFSLVELLVAIGIVGLLTSLVLSAVQVSRESARRVQCLDHLKQLGNAAMGHVSAHGGFPKTTAGQGQSQHSAQSISPHVYLLPFVEREQLYSRIDFDEPGATSLNAPPSSSANPELLTINVPLFRCPSDGQYWGGANNYRANMGAGPGALLAIHNGVAKEPANGTGAFRVFRSIRPAEISDGLSSTALFSERLVGGLSISTFSGTRDYFFPPIAIDTIADADLACWLPAGTNPAHDAYSGTNWLFGGYRYTWYNHVRTPNSVLPDCGRVSGAYAARSAHPGGVNLLLADGAGRFVDSSIEPAVWRALATRAGGEALSNDF